MKPIRLFSVCVLIVFGGCSLFSSPSATVKKLMSAIESGDIETAVSLWSNAAVKEQGIDKIRSDTQSFSQMVRTARAGGQIAMIENMRASSVGDRARVFFIYRASPLNSVGLGFALLKENGTWKLYRSIDISDEQQPFDSSFAPLPSSRKPVPDQSSSPTEMVSPPPPPGVPSRVPNPQVLNAKATSLPQPPYPPSARAAKVSGTVLVQVTVDEEGKVISAEIVSGHPLLRAAAEAAARQARFKPTIVDGQRVKVTGALVYEFKAP